MVQKSQYYSALNIKKKLWMTEFCFSCKDYSVCSLVSEVYDNNFCPTVRKFMCLPESETSKRLQMLNFEVNSWK